MISRIKDPSTGIEQGYLALSCDNDGVWQPVTGLAEPSADAAVHHCITDAREAIQDIGALVQTRLEIVTSNLARLLDHPTHDDLVRVHGEICTLDDDGAVILPARAVAKGPPFYSSDVEIDPKLYWALWQAMELKRWNRSEAIETMISAALNEPLDLLIAVRALAPEMLGQAAAFLVTLRERQRVTPAPPAPESDPTRRDDE